MEVARHSVPLGDFQRQTITTNTSGEAANPRLGHHYGLDATSRLISHEGPGARCDWVVDEPVGQG